MEKRIGPAPCSYRGRRSEAAPHVLPAETVRNAGVDQAIWTGLTPRRLRAVHDPLAWNASGGAGRVGASAFDSMVPRLIDTLAVAECKAVNGLRAARSGLRERMARLVGPSAPDVGRQLIVH